MIRSRCCHTIPLMFLTASNTLAFGYRIQMKSIPHWWFFGFHGITLSFLLILSMETSFSLIVWNFITKWWGWVCPIVFKVVPEFGQSIVHHFAKFWNWFRCCFLLCYEVLEHTIHANQLKKCLFWLRYQWAMAIAVFVLIDALDAWKSNEFQHINNISEPNYLFFYNIKDAPHSRTLNFYAQFMARTEWRSENEGTILHKNEHLNST